MSGQKHAKSRNPFEDEDIRSQNPFEDFDEDVDDETFLKNARRYQVSSQQHSVPAAFEDQLLTFQEKKRAIEERSINSTEKSLSVLRESEQIGIATAEELMRQREKLENTDKQLDEINATLRFSQKHINGIKSVFGSLKNYMSGKSGPPSTTSAKNPSTQREDRFSEKSFDSNYDPFDSHPSTRLRRLDYNTSPPGPTSATQDFSAKLDANLHEMCSSLSRLKGLATDMSVEIDSQNDLIGNITDKAEMADSSIGRQNRDMNRLIKK